MSSQGELYRRVFAPLRARGTSVVSRVHLGEAAGTVALLLRSALAVFLLATGGAVFVFARHGRDLLAISIMAVLSAAALINLWLSVRAAAAITTVERPLQLSDEYELIELLGSGAMGDVWRARHRLLARPTALKTVRPGVVSERELARFEREAQVTAELTNPHTIQIFDFGKLPDGTIYYAMELLEGINLDDFVRKYGPMPPGRAVRVLRQICASLAEAHDAGLVHRDVKPANIMLCRYGAAVDFVKVLDFGFVKSATAGATITGDDAILGTAAFLAPENLAGSAHVDHRADIYSLGCVAFWMLTGELPYFDESSWAIMRAHESAPLPSLRALRPDISVELEAVVHTCLAKAPEERFQSARAARRALKKLPEDATWAEEDGVRWWGNHLPSRGQLPGQELPSGPRASAQRTSEP